MKCFLCKHNSVTKRNDIGICEGCNGEHFAEKTDEDIIADGYKIFDSKIKRAPQYRDNQKAMDNLLMDCIKEARYSYELAKHCKEGMQKCEEYIADF